MSATPETAPVETTQEINRKQALLVNLLAFHLYVLARKVKTPVEVTQDTLVESVNGALRQAILCPGDLDFVHGLAAKEWRESENLRAHFIGAAEAFITRVDECGLRFSVTTKEAEKAFEQLSTIPSTKAFTL